jgi:hypothetical protein
MAFFSPDLAEEQEGSAAASDLKGSGRAADIHRGRPLPFAMQQQPPTPSSSSGALAVVPSEARRADRRAIR